MWRVVTLVAVLWPSHLSGWLDGAPLDTIPEALLLGLVVPSLLWLHPRFLRRRLVRATIVAILLIKVVAGVAVQQDGWCITFTPPRPWSVRARASRTRGTFAPIGSLTIRSARRS